jgi:hypothetical protein
LLTLSISSLWVFLQNWDREKKNKMKRGKGDDDDDDDEKVGPMFPRLHVNDTTDKGGPRAPPRNKMALYEQYTVPFQRFNPNSNSSNSLPLTPSSIMVSLWFMCF